MQSKIKGLGISGLLALSLMLGLGATKEASAYPGRHYHHYYPPYVFHGTYFGVPYGYGYMGYNSYGALPYFYNPYGYSYYGFYNYQPYYATYAAISYSVKEGKGGYAWGYGNRQDAADASARYCDAEECKPVVWVQGGCASLAVAKESKQLAWAYADTKQTAITRALRSCKATKAKDCESAAWVCSF